MNGSLRSQIFNGIGWRACSDIGQHLAQIVFTVILARLLTPADFGLVAMALLFNRFAQTFTQIGLGTAIVQSQEISNGQVSALFLVHLTVNMGVAVACFCASPMVAEFFREPELMSLARAVAWLIFISSFGFPEILMRKELRFQAYSIIELFSVLIGGGLGVVLALTGFGVWALVGKLFAQRLAYTILLWPLARWRPVFPQFKGLGKLFNFGLNMLGSNVCYFFSQNAAPIIIGKFIGAEKLGNFNIAYNIAIVPAQKIQSIFASVMTPAFSKLQKDLTAFASAYYDSLLSVGIVFMPVMFGLSAIAVNFTLLVYGSQWREAGEFLSFLSVVGFFKGLEHLMRSIVYARGWGAKVIFRIVLVETALSLPMLWLGARYFGAEGVIAAYLLVSITAFLMSAAAAQKASQSHRMVWSATGRTFIAAGVMLIALIAQNNMFPGDGVTMLLRQVLSGGLIYFILRFFLLSRYERQVVAKWPYFHWLLPKKPVATE